MEMTAAADLGTSPVLDDASDLEEVMLALLCVDVVGFTQMTERFGDRRSLAIMRRIGSLVSETVRRHRGVGLEIRGDSFLLAFPSSRRAVSCAAAIQLELTRDAESHPSEAVEVRIAIHVGTVLREGAHYFGRNLILPFRLLSVTHAGQISISAAARRGLGARWRSRLGRERSFLPKGFKQEVRFCRVDWDEAPRAATSFAQRRELPA